MASQNKVAFITGANKGIGFETARGLGELGIAVVIGSRDEAKGRAAADKLRADGIENVEAVRFDVTRFEDHQEIARHLEGRYGKLDILVNNAGVMLDEGDFDDPAGFNTTSTVTPEILRRTFDTNFFAIVALDAGALAADSQVPGRTDRESVEHPRVADAPRRPVLGRSTPRRLRLRRIEDSPECVHRPPGPGLHGTPIKVNSAHPGWVKTDMGGSAAPMEVSEGGKTSVQLATLPDDGPTGGYFHLGQPLPW